MADSAELRTDLPPFVVGTGNAFAVGRTIANVYAAVEANNISFEKVVIASAKTLGLEDNSPYVKAGLALAKDIDKGEGAGLEGGYHWKQHFKEVVMSVTQLALRNNAGRNDGIVLDANDLGKVLFAAIAHDYNYERGGNVRPNPDPNGKPIPVPYRLEEISFSSAKPYLESAGASKQDIADVGVMIYGTDVSPASQAGKFVREANYHLFEAAQKPVPSEVQARVAPILENPKLARLSALLSDADVMSSAGLSLDYNMVQSKKLEAETGGIVKATAGSAKFFVENIVGSRFTSPAGEFFQPNLDILIADYTKKLEAAAPAIVVPAAPEQPQRAAWVQAVAADNVQSATDAARTAQKLETAATEGLKVAIPNAIIAGNQPAAPQFAPASQPAIKLQVKPQAGR